MTDNDSSTPDPQHVGGTDAEVGAGPAYEIHQYPEKLVVVRLAAGADIPEWAESSSLFSITATATETALVCAGRSVPTKVPGARGLTGFAVAAGDSTTAGILLGLLEPLAAEDISVYTLTTFENVWILLASGDAERAAEAWRRRGHTVAPAVPA